LGNFGILKNYTNSPNEVANFLKEILRELVEPVCPFSQYERFRDISKTLTQEQKLAKIIDLLQGLEELNRSTLIYLARFFKKVSEHEAKNKMGMYNLAIIITPNLFKSNKLTGMDLMNHGTLTDVFMMLMTHVDAVISEI
jgi:hypothetical protein